MTTARPAPGAAAPEVVVAQVDVVAVGTPAELRSAPRTV